MSASGGSESLPPFLVLIETLIMSGGFNKGVVSPVIAVVDPTASDNYSQKFVKYRSTWLNLNTGVLFRFFGELDSNVGDWRIESGGYQESLKGKIFCVIDRPIGTNMVVSSSSVTVSGVSSPGATVTIMVFDGRIVMNGLTALAHATTGVWSASLSVAAIATNSLFCVTASATDGSSIALDQIVMRKGSSTSLSGTISASGTARADDSGAGTNSNTYTSGVATVGVIPLAASVPDVAQIRYAAFFQASASVSIPAGATITGATLELSVSAPVSSGSQFKAKLYGISASGAGIPTSYTNLMSRDVAASSAQRAFTNSDTGLMSFNITPIVQAMVNSSGWTESTRLCFYWKYDGEYSGLEDTFSHSWNAAPSSHSIAVSFVSGADSPVRVHDTTSSSVTVTHSPTDDSVVYFKNNGTGSLTVNAGAGLTFEGGGTSIVSNEKGDVIGLQKSGSVLYFVS